MCPPLFTDGPPRYLVLVLLASSDVDHEQRRRRRGRVVDVTAIGHVCVLHIKLLFPPVDMQYPQCPCPPWVMCKVLLIYLLNVGVFVYSSHPAPLEIVVS